MENESIEELEKWANMPVDNYKDYFPENADTLRKIAFMWMCFHKSEEAKRILKERIKDESVNI